MLSAPALGAMVDVPVSLVFCAAAVLVAILLVVAAVAWGALRRAAPADLPVVLLGVAHVISALCGLLPWGRPTPPPALPQQPTRETEPSAAPTVVLMRAEPAEPAVVRSTER
ncbi:hypothetical protein [Streptomyces aureus]